MNELLPFEAPRLAGAQCRAVVETIRIKLERLGVLSYGVRFLRVSCTRKKRTGGGGKETGYKGGKSIAPPSKISRNKAGVRPSRFGQTRPPPPFCAGKGGGVATSLWGGRPRHQLTPIFP